jgi:hypothetical protein
MPMKNPKDNIGNRTRDFPICNEVPQQTGSPRAANGVAGCTILTLWASVLGDTTVCSLVKMHRTSTEPATSINTDKTDIYVLMKSP